jgi:uncharacterized protein YndB with AHSA1/START domain
MSFQAYLDNIKAKTGKTTEDFINLATKKGLFKNPKLKPKEVIEWLKADYDLGHGHSMAIVAVFKQKGLMDTSANKKPSSKITKCQVSVLIEASLDQVWQCWNEPTSILKWYHASKDWYVKHAQNELKVGSKFNYGMYAKDESEGFDLIGTYLKIKPMELIEYKLDGSDREVKTTFEQKSNKVKVTQYFDPEIVNTIELQLEGWQAILDNFKGVCENLKND